METTSDLRLGGVGPQEAGGLGNGEFGAEALGL